MPNWKKIAKDMTDIVESAASASRSNTHSKLSLKRSGTQKQCLFWDCNVPIRADHFLCINHFRGFEDGLVDECPSCNRAKSSEYGLCLECHNSGYSARVQKQRQARRTSPRSSHKWYKKEHSPKQEQREATAGRGNSPRKEYSPQWEKRDATATEFFVYILKLNKGQFYAGQTRELRERLSEHRDGRVKSTAGKDPKLVWFAALSSRDAATSTEVELKNLIETNQREIRRMVVKFQDLIREVDYS